MSPGPDADLPALSAASRSPTVISDLLRLEELDTARRGHVEQHAAADEPAAAAT